MASNSDMKANSGLLAESWYVACLAKDLGKKPVSTEIMGVKIVVWQDDSGNLSALEIAVSIEQRNYLKDPYRPAAKSSHAPTMVVIFLLMVGASKFLLKVQMESLIRIVK